jgi:hypothetical protein
MFIYTKCTESLLTESSPEEIPLDRCVKKMEQEIFVCLIVFSTACFVVKNNKPFIDKEELLNM